jgi:cell division protein FtsW (lipid II flippase)
LKNNISGNSNHMFLSKQVRYLVIGIFCFFIMGIKISWAIGILGIDTIKIPNYHMNAKIQNKRNNKYLKTSNFSTTSIHILKT